MPNAADVSFVGPFPMNIWEHVFSLLIDYGHTLELEWDQYRGFDDARLIGNEDTYETCKTARRLIASVCRDWRRLLTRTPTPCILLPRDIDLEYLGIGEETIKVIWRGSPESDAAESGEDEDREEEEDEGGAQRGARTPVNPMHAFKICIDNATRLRSIDFYDHSLEYGLEIMLSVNSHLIVALKLDIGIVSRALRPESGSSSNDRTVLGHISHCCPNLRSLILHQTSLVNLTVQELGCLRLPHLTYLEIDADITTGCFYGDQWEIPSLRTLFLYGKGADCTSNARDWFEDFGETIERLILRLPSHDVDGGEPLIQWNLCPRLRELDFHGVGVRFDPNLGGYHPLSYLIWSQELGANDTGGLCDMLEAALEVFKSRPSTAPVLRFSPRGRNEGGHEWKLMDFPSLRTDLLAYAQKYSKLGVVLVDTTGQPI